jgi:hypothetical protein
LAGDVVDAVAEWDLLQTGRAGKGVRPLADDQIRANVVRRRTFVPPHRADKADREEKTDVADRGDAALTDALYPGKSSGHCNNKS